MLNWRKTTITLSLTHSLTHSSTRLTNILLLIEKLININSTRSFKCQEAENANAMDFDLIRDLIYWGVTITHAITCQTTNSPIRA